MIHYVQPLVLASLLPLTAQEPQPHAPWVIETQGQWQASTAKSDGIQFVDGIAQPSAEKASLLSVMQTFEEKRGFDALTLEQSPIWQNWEPTGNLGPANLGDAPVMLTMGPGNYWMMGMYRPRKAKAKGEAQAPFVAEPATLDGFDVELLTTPFPKQFDAPGGLNHGGGGYHAWQSRDMVHWVHHGPVTEAFSRWVTSAEYVDGKVHIYYDYPNDQDPHLYIDADLTDGKPGENMGIAFKDPSHGSDSGFIRDMDGQFHVIYEDWSPINASRRAWDSPLAGHAVSKDGISDFKILAPAVDHRTEPTGETKTYKHPHWLQHPDFDSNIADYAVHTPEQPAYGDWASIAIGGRYYLFGDHDPAGDHKMSVGWFTSPSIDEPFSWCDHIGVGHPDPDIAFAEGRFYLATQQKTDYTSTGPWVESVEVRAGIDTTNDGIADAWGPWQLVTESYGYTAGFAKQVQRIPATLDLSGSPEGFGFQFEVKLTDTTANKSKPMLDRVTLTFR